jgi:stage III sporulation protein AF
MNVMSEIVKNLLVIIIMSSFLEIMLPDGNIKPFVRFAIGLFVLIAILSPVLSLLYDNKNFHISVWDDRVSEHVPQQIETSGQELQQQIVGKSKQLMKEKLEGQISAIAILVPGVDNVQAQVTVGADGSPQKLQLTVKTGGGFAVNEVEQVKAFSESPSRNNAKEQDRIQMKIIQVINNLYGLKSESIEIVFEGG